MIEPGREGEPEDRVEPMERLRHAYKPVDLQIVPLEVRQFVQENAAQFPEGKPLENAVGQKKPFAPQPINGRTVHFLRLDQGHTPADSKGPATLLKMPGHVFVRDRYAAGKARTEPRIGPNEAHSKKARTQKPEA